MKPRVLVIRGGAIGDFILTLPAIRLLRQNLPQAEIEVMGQPGIADLAVRAGVADSIRSLGDRRLALLYAPGAAIDPALVEYLCGFNMLVSHLYDPDGILRANLERIGVKTLIECPHQVLPGRGHAAQQLARSLEKLAMFLEEPAWRETFFENKSAATAVRRIAIHPGSGSLTKNWPVAHWLRLAAEIQETHPQTEIVMVSGEAEMERGTLPADISFQRWQGLPLVELADRLGTCSLFLGHDSGISHLASACGVPALLLFGPTDPATWAPPQTNVRVLRAPGGELGKLPYEAVRDTVLAMLDQSASL